MNKKIYIVSAVVAAIVALVVGLLTVSLSKAPTPAPVQTPVSETRTGSGGNITQQQDFYTNGVGIGPDYVMFTRNGVIGTSQNEGFWTNRTGRTVYINRADVTSTGTASSTYRIYVGTTTAPTALDDFSAPYASLVNGFLWATSTAATTTSSIGARNTTNTGVIPVADGQSVFVQLQAVNDNRCAAALRCETATSTNRGITRLEWIIQGYYKP